MARAPRAWQAGIYHLGSHGSDDRFLFLSDGEREVFLAGLGEVLERFELGLVAYTLLGNHYHLLLRIQDARVSKAIQQLHTWYSRLHNKLNGRSAHLFRAHFGCSRGHRHTDPGRRQRLDPAVRLAERFR